MPQSVALKDQLTGFVPVEKAKGIMGFVAKGSALIPQSKLEPMTAPTKEFTFGLIHLALIGSVRVNVSKQV